MNLLAQKKKNVTSDLWPHSTCFSFRTLQTWMTLKWEWD